MAVEPLPSALQRFSISRELVGCEALPAESSPLELPISCLRAGASHSAEYLDPELLRLSADPTRKPPRGKGPVEFNLTDRWLAAVNYHHALPPGLAPARDLRGNIYSPSSSDAEHDIVDLRLSWTLWRNEVDLGYRFQSTRGESVGGPRYSVWRLLGSEDQLHGVSIGFTRRFGRTD